MQSKATSVAEYLASLPPDRRAALSAVRAVIRANIDKACVERMQYGMIGYAVPHSVFPAGYHCDPKQPLPFAALASQKGHMSVHLMFAYVSDASGAESGESKWFREAWAKTGKKLDMGKACVRFKKLDDVALDVLGEAIRRVPARKYIERYSAALAQMGKGSAAPARKPAAKTKVVAKSAVAPRKSKKSAK